MECSLEDLDTAAKRSAGNWLRWQDFAWSNRYEHGRPEDWTIFNTSTRDSGVRVLSNEKEIRSRLELFTESDSDEDDAVDVSFERHSHFAFGYVNCVCLRVFSDGQVTEAFKVFHDLVSGMTAGVVLNEADYCEDLAEETRKNIASERYSLSDHFVLEENWAASIYDWLREHDSESLDDKNDQGGFPSPGSLLAACKALGFEKAEEES